MLEISVDDRKMRTQNEKKEEKKPNYSDSNIIDSSLHNNFIFAMTQELERK